MPAPTVTKEAPLPTVPAEFASKIQAVVIQIKQTQLDANSIVDQYKANQAKLQQLNEKGAALESELLKSLKLDPEKYTTNTDKDGNIVIVKK